MELLGRPFDDARVVALGYAFEQANELRRAPEIAPPITVPADADPESTAVELTSPTASAVVRFEYVANEGRLTYETAVTAGDPNDVYAVVLSHEDDESRPSVAMHLSGPGVLAVSGELLLDEDLRSDLAAGALTVELITRGSPVARVSASIEGSLAGQGAESR